MIMTQTRPAKAERPYRAVGPEVAVEVAALGEDLVTQLTDEALVEVLLHVHLEVRGHAEPLGAHGAHMRLFPPVTHHVVPATHRISLHVIPATHRISHHVIPATHRISHHVVPTTSHTSHHVVPTTPCISHHVAHVGPLPPVTHHVVPAMANYLLFLYWRFIAQSTAQGHLRAFL